MAPSSRLPTEQKAAATQGAAAQGFRDRLLQVIARHQRGEIDGAITAYRALLAEQPWQFDALRLLGAALAARGEHSRAVDEYDRALRMREDFAEVWALRGAALSRLQRHAEAAASYQRAAALRSQDAGLWYRAGAEHLAAGNLDHAVSAFERALVIAPDLAQAWCERGVALTQAGQQARAQESFGRAHALKADNVDFLCRQAHAEHDAGRSDEALFLLDRALAMEPRHRHARFGRAEVLRTMDRVADALLDCDCGLAVDERDASGWALRGALLENLIRFDEAIASYERALALEPDFLAARLARERLAERAAGAQPQNAAGPEPAEGAPDVLAGETRRLWRAACESHRSGQLDSAANHCRQILAKNPEFADARRVLAATLYQLGRYSDALPEIERALRTLSTSGELWLLHGRTLWELGRAEEALRSTRRSVEHWPDVAGAWTDLGHLQLALEMLPEAIRSFERAQLLEPDRPDHVFNEAMALLASGDFERGWAAYEARLQVADFGMQAVPGVPLWTGSESLRGRTLVVCCEQGLGDTIQFCRFLPLAAARGARVILGVQPALRNWLASVPGAERVVTQGEALPPVDLQCWIMSLPHLLGAGTDVLGSGVPYLKPRKERVEDWNRRLALTGTSRRAVRRIGIVCSGNPRHTNDRHRSIPLEQFAEMIMPRVKDTEWHLLQNALRPEDEPWLERLGIADHRGALGDFGEAAALTACMDAVVSVDTSLAHLAGAMGVPLHLLIPLNADWRWMFGREDSPWYPGARLWRQRRTGHWSEPLQSLRQTILAQSPSKPGTVPNS